MKVDFTGRVVLVTGAGRGLGEAYARLIARLGGVVVVHDGGVERDGTGGEAGPANAVANSICNAGGQTRAETVNLNTREACEGLIERTVQQFGRLDALIHNAGIVRYGPITQTTPEEWEAMRLVSVDAPFWLCRAAWPYLLRQDYGRIVLTASGYGLEAWDGSDVTAYGVGKAAQFGLMNGLAGETAGTGIRVNVISPVAGTRIFRDQSRAAALPPENVAAAVALLASEACPWNGQVLSAAGGRYRLGQFTHTQEGGQPAGHSIPRYLTGCPAYRVDLCRLTNLLPDAFLQFAVCG